MPRDLAHVALLVRDYDEALAYYVGVLGFHLVEDAPREPGKRWVVVAPGATGTSLLLARAATPEQAKFIGNQSGGRVWLFLHTDDFQRDHARLLAAGVRFAEAPRHEPYGTVAVFEDLYGNRWDLIEPVRIVAAAPVPVYPLHGGCLCGSVRYTVTGAPRAATLCHCRSCRLASGAPSVAWVVFAVQDVAFEGARTAYASSPGVTRTFCGRCGTSLTWQRDDHADTIDLQTATLDNPDAFPPAKEIWVGEKIAWEALNHEAVHYPESSVANTTGSAP